MCGFPGHLAPVHRCAPSVRCVACGVFWATWLLFTAVPAQCVRWCVQCPGPLGSCSPVCLLGALCCLCGVLGHLAPVPRCARLVRCVSCAVSWATWLLFLDVLAPCIALRVQCPGPLGPCSPVCPLGALCCVCGVLGHLAPFHRCACWVRCVAYAVPWATSLLFAGVLAWCVVFRVRCPGPLGSCSWMCSLCALRCVCSVLGPLAPVHRYARSVFCVAYVVSWPLGFCSSVCPLGAVCCVCGVLGHWAPVHRCARSVRCVVCAVSWAPWLLSPGVPAGVRCVACAVSQATWLLFTGVLARCVLLCVRCPQRLDSCSAVCSLGALCCVCDVLGHLAPVHRYARSVRCVACAVSSAPWLLFTSMHARCVALRVWCPGPLGFWSSVCPLGVLRCVCGVLGPLAPLHQSACSVLFVACAVSWATWLLFTGVPARCVVLRARCLQPLGSCSPVCTLGALRCVYGVLSPLAPVHRYARSVRSVACAVSWAAFLLLIGVPARCFVLRVRCPGPLGSCSPECPLGALRCVCGVLGHLTPVHRTACWVRCARRMRRPGPLGSCSPMCSLGLSCCVCRIPRHLAPVHRCPCSVRCVACAVSWATWLLFASVLAWCVVLRVRCLGPLGSCSRVCSLDAFCCVCGELGHLAPVHRCARSVRCVACAVSQATWLLFTGVLPRCVVLRVGCSGRLGSCSPLCPLNACGGVCSVLGHLAPVHRCACWVRCVACAVSWATWLLFPGVLAWCVVFRVRCPGPLGSCSWMCSLRALRCVCSVLGHLAPVRQCARSVRCVACAVSWATWLLFTGVLAGCVVLPMRCPGPLRSCSPVCSLGALCFVCGVLGHLAPVLGCARSVHCVACAVSWATWLLFASVPARCVVLRVWCPGPLGSCSPVCPLGALHCVCGVLGPLASVNRCSRWVRCVACAVSQATWLLFTGVLARCVLLCVRCPGALGSCSAVCSLGAFCCVRGVLGNLAPVHRYARSLRCIACVVSWATWLLVIGVPAGCLVLRLLCPGPLGSCSAVCPLGVLRCVCVVTKKKRTTRLRSKV